MYLVWYGLVCSNILVCAAVMPADSHYSKSALTNRMWVNNYPPLSWRIMWLGCSFVCSRMYDSVVNRLGWNFKNNYTLGLLKFWAPTPMGRGPRKNTNFQLMIHQWATMHCSRANKLSTRRFWGSNCQTHPISWSGAPAPQNFPYLRSLCSTAPAVNLAWWPTMTRQLVLLVTQPPHLKGVGHPKNFETCPIPMQIPLNIELQNLTCSLSGPGHKYTRCAPCPQRVGQTQYQAINTQGAPQCPQSARPRQYKNFFTFYAICMILLFDWVIQNFQLDWRWQGDTLITTAAAVAHWTWST